MANIMGTIGGDADLSPNGEKYARKLPELVRQSVEVRDPSLARRFLMQRSLDYFQSLANLLGWSQPYCLDLHPQAHYCDCPLPPKRVQSIAVEGT